MSDALQYYLTTLLVYLGIDILAVWGLNLQFGVTGVLNFGYIVFQAAGAYTAAVLTLGPDTKNGGFQTYIAGSQLPFPLPLIAGTLVAAVLSLVVALLTLRRLRSDYQAMVLLVFSVIASSVVVNATGLFNGPPGLALVPQPLQDQLSGLSPLQYSWFFVGLTGVICLIVYVFVHRITDSPLGRSLRATRENERAAAALGKDGTKLRLFVFVVGGAIAGLSGALLVSFIGTWAPGSWLYVETFTVLTAIIVGGSGNNIGVMLGALLIPVGLSEATRFLPPFGYLGLIDALQWVAIGAVTILFLWFRPQGIVPEVRRRFGRKKISEQPAAR